MTNKKTFSHPKADQQARQAFTERIKLHRSQGRRIVYQDESGFEKQHYRTHGYALKGQRCLGKRDWHTRERINAVGAMIDFKLINVCLFEGTINSDIFYAWLTLELLPLLVPEDVLVLDNATFHKRKDMIQAIEQKGVILEYLPTYSPDLNPIEQKWAQAKAYRRKHKCEVDDIFKSGHL